MMIAFLTSSPCIFGAPRAILNPENGFIRQLHRCLPPRIRCLFICSAPDDPKWTDKVGQEMAECFAEAGFPFADLVILDRRNMEQAQMLIWESDLILLAGGHVPTQNAFFQEIQLKKLLRDYQGVLLGISAGTMNCAQEVYAQPEEAGESAPDFQRFLPGLGLTDVQILPHYQQVKDYTLDGKRLFENITYTDSIGHCFFAFVDGTYLLIEGGCQKICGEAYAICNGELRQISQRDEIITLEA
jgi:dipeptidase E